MEYDVIAVADIFADVIIVSKNKPEFDQVEKMAEGYALELGGSAPIFASQFAKLGGRIAITTFIGQDALGDFLLQRLREVKVDCSKVFRSALPTPLGLNISVSQDRALLTVLGALQDISAKLLDESFLSKTRHWHIAGYFLIPQLIEYWPRWAARLQEHGITISLDTNWSPNGNWKQVQSLLPLVNVFLPNEAEAMAISGMDNYYDAGVTLSESVNWVVIKRGADGASVFHRGIETKPQFELSHVAVADTTGAGDNFDAGYIFEWLRGASAQECLKMAIRCGTSSVQNLGGISGQVIQN